MKLSYVHVLAYIPASLAFALIPLKRPAVGTDSSLNVHSFLEDHFSADNEEQKALDIKQFKESVRKGLELLVEEEESTVTKMQPIAKSVPKSMETTMFSPKMSSMPTRSMPTRSMPSTVTKMQPIAKSVPKSMETTMFSPKMSSMPTRSMPTRSMPTRSMPTRSMPTRSMPKNKVVMASKPKNMVAGYFKHMPTKEMTGVETHICRLAATMSAQCYDIHNQEKDTFKLSTKDHDVDTIFVAKQGLFQSTSPTFGAAVCGDTMILAWRGSSPDGSPMDLVNDIACSPCSNFAWREHAKILKLQGAMTSLCVNDISSYEEMIISECKERGIKEIVTTGHSLGGGIGQCAHTILRAQIQDKLSPWFELNGIVNVRSVVFSAPMTTIILDGYTTKNEQFMNEINENSCNLIFSHDPIPRGYGHLSFIKEFFDSALKYMKKGIADRIPLPNILIMGRVNKIVNGKIDAILGNESFDELLDVLIEYIHPGKIIYYETEETKPSVLNNYSFRGLRFKFEEKVNPLDKLDFWHMAIVRAPGLAYDDSVLL